MQDTINLILNDYIQPTLGVLVVIGIIYALLRGIFLLFADGAGQRLAILYFLMMPIVSIGASIKVSITYEMEIWKNALVCLAIAIVWMWLGRLLFPKSNIFGSNNENDR